LFVSALKALGFQLAKPQASFFLYAPAPKAVVVDGRRQAFANAEEFSQWLIREHLISTVPWDDAGPFVRFSVTFVAPGGIEEEKRVINDIKFRLSQCAFEF
jgi:LL-diaminopimelate aminotransferase